MHDMPTMLPPLTWQALWHTWQVRPAWTVAAVLLGAAYAVAYRTARRHGPRPVHPLRVLSFGSGLVLLVFTVSSAVGVYAMAVFWDHMIEHLMLIMVVPTLLVLGHPLQVLRAAAATRGHAAAVDRVLTRGPVALLTHPLVGFALYTVVIVATHLTSFMDAMATHGWLMGAEQVLYLVTGYVFLLPLLGSEPIRWHVPYLGRLVLILLAMTPDTVVGIVLMQTTSNPFPVMEAAHPAWAPPPLQDVQTAGGLMWAGGDGLMMFMGIAIALVLITHPGGDVVGPLLEGVRRRTLAAHVSHGAEVQGSDIADDADVDSDDTVLEAYNRMLGRLNRGPSRD